MSDAAAGSTRVAVLDACALVPIFATLAADQIRSRDGTPDEPSSPITALLSADQDEAVAAFGEAGDLTDPAQVALRWWMALDAEPEVGRELTLAPRAWGNYQWAIDMLAEVRA